MDMSDSSNFSSIPPDPVKRRRRLIGTRGGDCYVRRVGQYWFADGDIVLEVGKYWFKVHSNKLMCSEIFSDMFKMPQPHDAEKVDGCPFVWLADSAEDWLATVKWLYSPQLEDIPHPVPFHFIPSALRMAAK
ncbi:hypothetical protein OBBRIDRAFT_795835 [Obba rivulosa]|uniref:BTB domain-containing protein n=1 Tax=Obba rivulosa TaxID=1052685 RepID=A0A8E2DH72_9APHY|nr:hypothetical protein OBBRIDRAFT_795835 [Obba rivulosa]